MLSLNFADEMGSVDLGDKRLNKRCLKVIDTFAACPEKSIPSACDSHAESKSAYRFLKNEKVSQDKIFQPHYSKTIQRCQKAATVLYIEDTTEIDLSNNSVLQDLGRLDHKDRKGMYCHTALTTTPEGYPLGVANVHFFDREPKPFSSDRNYHATPLEEKESFRWVQGIRNASKLAKESPSTQVIYVADRESDTFHCLFEAKKPDTHCDIVIRACKDRNTRTKIPGSKKKFKRLFPTLEEMSPNGQVSFETHSGHGTQSRQVTQTLRFGAVTLRPHRPQANDYQDIEINAIMLTEEDPPVGSKAINWVLLTTLPLNNPEDVLQVIRFYTSRWNIEVYFKILKVYCRVEELKLKDIARLQACIAVYMIVACRLLLIQKLADTYPEEKCSLAFTDLEWKVVYLKILTVQKRSLKHLPADPPSLREFLFMLAQLGGFLGRKSDGKPGPKSICQGYSKMRVLVEGWELCQKHQSCG